MKTVHNFERILLQFDDLTLEAECGIERLTKTDLSRVLHKSSLPAPIAIRRDGFIWTSQPRSCCQVYWRHQTFCPLHSIHLMPSHSAADHLHKFQNQCWTVFICRWGWAWESGQTFSAGCMMRKVQGGDPKEWAGQSLSWAPHRCPPSTTLHQKFSGF